MRALENFYGGQTRVADLNTRIPPESFAQGPTEEIITTVLPGPGYDQELPAYSDAPTSILEDYDAQDLGGPLRWRVGDAFHPIDTSGYPDRDLEEDELFNERLYKSLNAMNPDTLPGWKYTGVNPYTTPYAPIEEDIWTETHPDLYDFLGQTYGPTGMDIYDAEEEERRKSRGLWGPQYYPDQLGPVDI